MAKRKSSPNGIIETNIVWDASSDTYSHVDIKTWLDNFDAAIGALFADRVPLGTIVPWSFPDKTAPDSSALSIPTGYALCNGQTLTSSQHDFPSPFAGASVVLPDYRNRVLIGADTGGSIRTAGSATVTPKIKGRQGANVAALPDHFHTHQHIHRAGKVAGIETYHAVPGDATGGGLNDSPVNNPCTINTDASGTGHNVVLQGHAHQLASFYTSGARNPQNPSVRTVDVSGTDLSANSRVQTTLQQIASGGDATEPTGGSAGADLDASAYQESEGVYYLMKVKWGTEYSRPWAIRNSAGSVDTVGTA